jgi:hypothetical protein
LNDYAFDALDVNSASTGVTMASDAYRAMARECYELARQTKDDVERRELILLAAQWTEFAELKEKPNHSKLH